MWTARKQCRAHRSALPQPAPAAERLKDVAHASGFGAWISVPLVVVAMTAVAIISGGLTALGRVAALGAETVFLGLGVLGRLRAVPGRLRAALTRAFVLHPDALTSARAAFPHVPPPSAPALPGMPTDQALVLIEQAMAEIPAKGDAALPDDVATLALLLSPAPPGTDFQTADLVRNCFAAPAMDASTSRALLAVALRLARGFGTQDRLPLATIRAWRMLDPEMFEAEMAAQLAAISLFIAQWQETQQTFLCLEFAEVELIEFLFESLPPARHGDGLCDILNFKVLSNRRQGILRRIPHRLRKSVQNCGGRGAEAIAAVEATRTLLDRIAASHAYPPIVEAANAALDEVKKIAETLQPPPAAPAEAEPPLARIAPVKRPATAAEIAAMIAAAPGPRPPAPPPARQIAAPSIARHNVAPSPHLSAGAPPFRSPAGIGTVASRAVPASVSAMPARLPPGSRPPLPVVAMGPLPVPAVPAPSAPALPIATGRIAIPAAAARPVTGVIAPPTATGRPPTATGRIVIPPPAPAEAKTAVTALTVVPRSKRAPITQAIKRQSVLKVLRGESTATVAASLGLRVSKLDEWVDAFITAGAGALSPAPRKRRPRKSGDEPPLSVEMLRAKLTEVLATAQLIERAMDAQIQPRRPVLLPPPGSNNGAGRPHKKG